MSDEKDVLFSEEGQSAAPEDTGPITTEGVSPEAPARDEHGRFAPKAEGEKPVAAPAAAEGAPPAPVEDKQPHTVPLSVVLDDREKRQKAEARAAALEAQLRAIQAQQQPKALPDPIEDAPGFLNAIRSDFDAQRMNDRVMASRFHAERDPAIGPAGLAEVDAFFNDDPKASWQFVTHPSPIHAAWEWLQGEKLRRDIGTDPRGWEARKEAEIRARVEAELRQPSQPSAPHIPPSLAAAAGSSAKPPPARGGDPLFD